MGMGPAAEHGCSGWGAGRFGGRAAVAFCLFLCLVSVADGRRQPESKELACELWRPVWRRYHEAYTHALQTANSEAGPEQRAAVRSELAQALSQRTANISDVLSCNVGVIAGYYLLARMASPAAVESLGAFGASEGEANLAYRLLQMALIFIFTLRNGNRIPDGPGMAWAITEQAIIPAIMQLKKGHDWLQRERLRRSVPISPSFRDRSLHIAVVSICAYPPDHPLALPKVTPPNRDAYTRRHGYELRLHLEPPVLGAHGLGVQHAKLATVLAYMQSSDFDWIAWFDCDSIFMNLERTLDSIIYQYAQQRGPSKGEVEEEEEVGIAPAPICGAPAGPPDVSGEWLDSWVPPDMQDEAAVQIRQSPDGTLQAAARQFGEAAGRVDEDASLELDFEGGALKGRVIVEEDDAHGNYAVRLAWENGAVWDRRKESQQARQSRRRPCREPCLEPGLGCTAELDPDVDLLITEEGWGLSSANWMIRRSAWSLKFLHDALTAAHVEMKLFGDQDAIILHIMNQQALGAAAGAAPGSLELTEDPLDRHVAIVPQFELNSYDALNALTMECDMFVEGDLLITFPQCKDAEGCNDVFNLAADYGKAQDKPTASEGPHLGAWWLRREGPVRWPGYRGGPSAPSPSMPSSAAIRVFGPRPLVRDIFMREQMMQRGG